MSITVGNHVGVTFPMFANKQIQGKVDTGATMSSIHATDIQIDPSAGTVSFVCPPLSTNRITIPLDTAQDVRSADGGTQRRPVIKLSVEIEGVTLPELSFNLNDRSDMDDQLLIGQNVLHAGNFIVDVKEDVDITNSADLTPSQYVDNTEPSQEVLAAIRVLVSNNITLAQFAKYATISYE